MAPGEHGLPTAGTTVSHYRVLSPLGSGGMGAVYLAEDLKLKRKVALKFLKDLGDDRNARRLLREAEIASQLDHPNIATIYEIGDWDGQPFIAMAHVPGETLRERLCRGPLSLTEVATVGAQVTAGLAAAHEAGIVHRDLKPGNVMLTPSGQVKILDFGLARSVSPDLETATRITREQTTLGTLAYMAPEQVSSADVDQRADIWALGVVLFEMLTGRHPFESATPAAFLVALTSAEPPSVRQLSRETPLELEAAIASALEREPARRSISAKEIHDILLKFARPVGAVAMRRRASTSVVGAVVLGLLAIAVGGGWFVQRWRHQQWARTAIPKIRHLADGEHFVAADALLKEARQYLPQDAELANLASRVSRPIGIDSAPSGARVWYAAYATEPNWQLLGTTPLSGALAPRGVLRWRVEKDGSVPFEDATVAPDSMKVVLSPLSDAPEGMVYISTPSEPFVRRVSGELQPAVTLGAFWIDRYEVTNRQYAAFVDAGGYTRSEFWKMPFRDANAALVTWKDAMARFRDRTGRPGPATWVLGRFPEGHGTFPVTGISWYEAAAYAAFAGKSLPTLFHWSYAAGHDDLIAEVTPLANFSTRGVLPVDRAQAIHRFGTRNLAGNVKEWVYNESSPGERYILGGAWDEPEYMFAWPDARSAWERGENFGFRCVRYADRALPAALERGVLRQIRDYSREKAVGDELFAAYTRVYSYDRAPISGRVESTDDTMPHWRRETISIPAAYGHDRVLVHVFLPKRGKPPYHAVLYLSGSGIYDFRSSRAEIAAPEGAFLVQEGRALVLPIVRGAYERSSPAFRSDTPRTSVAFRDHVVDMYKDLARTVDYLQTRREIAMDKLAYVGWSRSAALAPIVLSLERRIRTAVLCIPGFYAERFQPEIDVVNFAPRVKIPVLVLNGKYDFAFPEARLQEPFFNALGTAPADKRRIVYPTGHNLPPIETIKETLAWLDKYLGPVD